MNNRNTIAPDMSLLRCGNPRAYERANDITILQSW
jgi:hypothetical protein